MDVIYRGKKGIFVSLGPDKQIGPLASIDEKKEEIESVRAIVCIADLKNWKSMFLRKKSHP